MVKRWVRQSEASTANSATGLVANFEIWHNDPQLVSTEGPVSKQLVTVVANFLMAITTTEDIFSLRYVVAHEDFPTLTIVKPQNFDAMTRGMYPFAKGPVYFNPRAGIDIPPNHKLWLQLEKQTGAASSDVAFMYNLLLNIRMS